MTQLLNYLAFERCVCLSTVRTIYTSNPCLKIVPNDLKGKSKSSQEWLTRQLNDVYVRKAKIENYRARSAFKLIEIDDKFKILQPGDVVVDCGAAPGSWTQVAVQRINALKQDKFQKQGKIIAVDLYLIRPIEGAILLGGMDFTSNETQEKIINLLDGAKVDVVLSDMAPNASGIKTLDQECIMNLCFAVLNFGLKTLKDGGTLLCKLWGNQDTFYKNLEHFFKIVKYVKPHASRGDSSETFFLAKEFHGLLKK